MRITAGKFKARTLAVPGDASVRPTSDKVRQAIFNILEHRDFGFSFALEGARVVDLFAGTEALGLTGATKIWRRDASALGQLDTLSPFDLAFLDPPYRKGLLAPALAGLRTG